MAPYTGQPGQFGTTVLDPETGKQISLAEWAAKQAKINKAEAAPSTADLWASMQDTEDRASADRLAAIEAVKAGTAGTQTGPDMEALRSLIATATPGTSDQGNADVDALRKLVAGYTSNTTAPAEGADVALWRNLVQKLAASPETINSGLAGQMFDQARVPVEAQTQQSLRNIQESYYARGVPGGAMRSATQQAEIGKAGNLGNIQFQIAKARAATNKSDQLNAIGAAGNLATGAGGLAATSAEQARADALSKIGAASNLASTSTGLGQTAFQQLMQKIAAMTGLAEYTGSAGQRGGETLANIYGSTIPKVAKAGTARAAAGL